MSLASLAEAGPWIIAGIAGLLAGSFLNVAIYRGPHQWGLVDGESRGDLARPRSYCPACKTPIPFWRLVPIVSFVLQQGRCAQCGTAIPVRYPVVEAIGGGVAIIALAAFGPTPSAAGAAVFGWALTALAFIDLETGFLPDAITLPLIALGLAANAFGLFVPVTHAIIGAIAGYGAFSIIGWMFEQLRGKEGLGLGDAKLLAAIGAWGGWIILPAVVFIGAVATLLAIVSAKAIGKSTSMDQPIPFGPGLCIAGFVALIAAPGILSGL
ncbi:MAG: A24 family peptidase [Parvularculaceae bacterium]